MKPIKYNHMKTLFLGFLIFSQQAVSAGASLDEFHLKSLKEAKSLEDIFVAEKLVRELNVEVLACELQLERNILPTRCYVALNMSKKLDIDIDEKHQLKRVNQQCEQNAQITKQTHKEGFELLPKSCLQLAQAQVAKNRYKVGMIFEQ